MNVNPLIEIIRFYEEGLSYEGRDPYDLIATAVWVDSTTVSIQGMKGHLTAERYKEITSYYRDKGVTKILLERKGRNKIIDLKRKPQDL